MGKRNMAFLARSGTMPKSLARAFGEQYRRQGRDSATNEQKSDINEDNIGGNDASIDGEPSWALDQGRE